MGAVHSTFAWIAIAINGVGGLICLFYAVRRRTIDRFFKGVVGVAVGSMLLQVAMGLITFGQGTQPGSIHMFYGFVILFTFTFVYIYRVQFEKRPALGWGLVMLFAMGLGLRAWSNFGQSF